MSKSNTEPEEPFKVLKKLITKKPTPKEKKAE